ncbi:MAG: beta-phosphoglucomutase [Spirochaetales bacterium]|nr:beta-phosphoglucomutase [Spirochaetales bacterium]
MSNIKGFIFDLDGVITDTAEYHYLAWKRLADDEGVSFSREDNDQLRGVSREASLKLLLKGKVVTDDHFKEMAARKNAYYVDYIKGISPADMLPGVLDILKELKSRGIKISLGSASKNARTVIKGLQVGEYFDNISDGGSVKNAKPAPDLFLHAAKNLGLKPEECIVVEDARSGVEAGLAAGMVVIGIGPAERVGEAQFRYDEPGDIDLSKVLG